jgi:hypothetical protein
VPLLQERQAAGALGRHCRRRRHALGVARRNGTKGVDAQKERGEAIVEAPEDRAEAEGIGTQDSRTIEKAQAPYIMSSVRATRLS